jgi:hypothetical protein
MAIKRAQIVVGGTCFTARTEVTMTDATAESLLAVLQRLADAHVELKLKVDAAEEVLLRNNRALYDEYVSEMNELRKTERSSISEALVVQLRTKLIEG